MANKSFRYFLKGIELRGETTDPSDNIEGSVWSNSTFNRFKGYIQSAIREFVTTDQAQTLTNKSLVDSSTIIVDAADATKQIKFDANGSTGTSTTIQSSQTVDRVIALPDVSDTLVGVGATQTLTNKTLTNPTISQINNGGAVTVPSGPTTLVGTNSTQTLTNKNLVDATTAIVGSADATKKVIFENGPATTNTTLTLQSSQTANRVITFPDASDTVVTQAATQTLLNKTIDAGGNTISNIANTNIAANAQIDASKIANGTVSNAEFQTLDGVTSSIQTQLNAKADSSALTAHTGASTGVHGVTGSVVGTTDTQTLTNKTLTSPTITGASIQSPIRSDVKQGTKSALQTYASTAANGQLVFATDTKEYLAVKDGVLVDIGGSGGVGSVDTLMSQTFDKAALTDFTQTGMELVASPFIQGAFTARLIHQAATTYSFKQVVSVNPKFRGQLNTLAFSARSSALSANVTVTVTDETNSTTLLSSTFTTGQITAAVFNTASSTTVTVTDRAILNQILVGATITGSGIPTGTTVTAVNSSAGTLTISQSATATATGVSLKVSVLPKTQKYSFAVPASCASLSYTITALSEAGLPETYVDDVQIYLSQSANSSYSLTQTTFNATDWTPYTPTFTGFGTPSAVEFEWRQVGANYEIRGKFTSGTSTAVEARVSLPNSANSAGTTVIPSISLIGAGVRNQANTSLFSAFVPLIEPSVGYVTFGLRNTTVSELTKQNGTALVASGDIVSFFASVPIAGLSANTTTTNTIPLTSSVLVTQPDSYLRIIGFTANVNGSTATKIASIASGSIQQNVGSAIQYLDDSVNGARFVAQQEGLFRFSFSADTNSVGAGTGLSLNSSNLTTDWTSLPASEKINIAYDSGSAGITTVFGEVYLRVGDTVRIHREGANNLSNGSYSTFSASYQGSTKILNPSSDQKIQIPTHQLRFEGASARGSTDTAIVKFDTQTITQGDAWDVVNTAANGTVITMKKAGRLSVDSTLYLAPNQFFCISLNQSTLSTYPSDSSRICEGMSSVANSQTISISKTFDVKSGDKIRIAGTANINPSSSNNLSLSLQETSVAVALQNVTPTYDNSDSAVRVNTANGFGSTNTYVRRFSNNPDNFGTDITYTDSATLGASFTINKDGLYQFSYVDVFTGAAEMAITKNSTILNASYATLSPSLILCSTSTGGNNFRGTTSGTAYLLKGDVLRPQTNTTTTGGNSAETQFTISRVGKTSGTVDVTPFVQIPQNDVEAIEALTASTSWGSTNTGVAIPTITKNTNKGIIQVVSDSTNGTYFLALKDCEIKLNVSPSATTAVTSYYITKNATTLTATTPDGIIASSDISNAIYSALSSTVSLVAGDKIRIQRLNTNVTGIKQLTLTATAISNSIAAQTQTVSSDTMSFVFKSTAIDPNTDAIGTFNTYTYAANTNIATIATIAPTQTTSSMNVNGIQVFARAYNAASTAAQPARVDIFIGKGLKNCQVDAYLNAGKTSAFSYDYYPYSTNVEVGVFKSYNETTGILSLDAGMNILTTTTTKRVDGISGNTTGYFVFNASKAPSLVTVPQLQPRIAYISEQQTSGTNGGSSVATTWTTRTLNTLVDNTGIVTSLSSNTITLGKGTYSIRASSPAVSSTGNRLRLRNITDGTTLLIGETSYSAVATTVTSNSTLQGEIILTSAKSLALQYYVGSGQATNGLGVASSSGEVEVYGQITITKIRD